MQAIMQENHRPLIFVGERLQKMALANTARRQLLKLETFVVQYVDHDGVLPVILIDRPLPGLVERTGASAVLSQRGSDGRYSVTVQAFGVTWRWLADKPYAWSGVARSPVSQDMPVRMNPDLRPDPRGILCHLRVVGSAT